MHSAPFSVTRKWDDIVASIGMVQMAVALADSLGCWVIILAGLDVGC